MRIVWNQIEKRFEAELTPGAQWSSDKEAAQKAGMRCVGPPLWTWYCTKPSILSFLREHRPDSGLTITPEALEHYNTLKAVEDANLAVRAALKEARKAQKKEQKAESRAEQPSESEVEHGEFVYLKVDRGESSIWQKPVVSPPPTTLCHACLTPVYHYELQDPPTCLDCEFPEIKA
jgi:hypothetical protein